MKLGLAHHQTLAFARRVQGWHPYAMDKSTGDVMRTLAAQGLLELNERRQFRITLRGRLYRFSLTAKLILFFF